MPYKDPEKRSACTKAWVAANPQKHRATCKAWHTINRERDTASNRAWRIANPEKATTKSLKWRTTHQEKHRAGKRAWQKANPWKAVAYVNKRRGAKKQAVPRWANQDLILAVYERAKASGLVVDHIVPLQSKLVCGLHWEGNLQLLTAAQNSAKGNKLIPGT